MKNLMIPCPFCDVENKLTVFQADEATFFKVKCIACAREFQIDAMGKILDLKGSILGMEEEDPTNGYPHGRAIEPPLARVIPGPEPPKRKPEPLERMKEQKIRESVVREEREHEAGGKESQSPETREPQGSREPRIVPFKELQKDDVVRVPSDSMRKRKPETAEIIEKRSESRDKEWAVEDRRLERASHEPEKKEDAGGQHPLPRYPYPPPYDLRGRVPYSGPPPGGKQPPGPYGSPIPNYPIPNYPFPYPFQYSKLPFTRNPEWAWKLLVIAAILGVVTALILFLSMNYYMDGGIEDMALTGQVMDPGGQPIANATIWVVDMNISRTTDANGRYEFKELDSGTHTLQITASKYQTKYYKFTMSPEQDGWNTRNNVEKDFIMHPKTQDYPGPETEDKSIGNSQYFLPTLMIVASTVTFLGGLMARRKKHWALCLTSAFIGIFSLGFFVVSPILCILAIVILFRTRYAFQK